MLILTQPQFNLVNPRNERGKDKLQWAHNIAGPERKEFFQDKSAASSGRRRRRRSVAQKDARPASKAAFLPKWCLHCKL